MLTLKNEIEQVLIYEYFNKNSIRWFRGLASAATLYETGKESVPTLKASENIRRQPSESDDGKADCRTGHR